jgi:murein DD-endopeptidase MepM/ murein hydrolase activator NlpD
MRKISYLSVIIALILVSGCTRAVYRPRRAPPPYPRGVYHRVEKGETLWRIAKTYRVDLEELKDYNNIRDVEDLKVGTLIFIPGAKERIPVSAYINTSKIGNEGFTWPAEGKIVSYYNTNKGGLSKGIDVALPFGSKVKASKQGIVSYADVLRGYGKVIIVDHQDGFSTVYAHNSKLMVKENDFVERGEVIAISGNTGNCKSPLLHFEIRKGETPQDPLYYLP